MLQKFANQTTINPQVQSQTSTSSPLPSQPLPNPKGCINAVHSEGGNREEDEVEDEEGEDDWLYELLAELANSDESDDVEEVESEDEEEVEEEVESETKEEDEEEVSEENDKGKTFFIATIFSESNTMKEEIPVKCDDPRPCTVTCKILGWISPIAYAIPELVAMLCPSREVFTTADASIVLVVGIAENVPVQIGQLTIPADFHWTTHKFKKKVPEEKSKGRIRDNPKGRINKEKESRNAPPQSNRKKKKVPLNPERKKKKKKEPDEDRTEKKRVLKCLSFNGLLGKLKVLKEALRRNKSLDAHLVKTNSK
ncbi:hypothetical protein PIB30_028535 [Stylosanthes scabra]|uniref:Uncharacterized protein n=1 Tax=Stylosanthes scabra TaxID=79078 RepID=A0ABU6SB86_9FABA|nr:hypothetical protein [Stylosanthes scabra]